MNTTSVTKKERTLRIISLTITVAIMILIFVQSAMPDYVSSEESNIIVILIESVIEKTGRTVSNRDLVEFVIRKIAHFTEYAAFGASLLFTTSCFLGCNNKNNKTDGEPRKKLSGILFLLIPWLFGIFYAATDEIHQLFVPGRYGKFHDVLIDSAGVAVGILICYFILRNLYKSRS